MLANDHDGGSDSDPIRVIAASSKEGQAIINPDGSVSFTPRRGFVGTATVTYVITDDNGGTSMATLTVVVKPQIVARLATAAINLPAAPASEVAPLHVEGAVMAAVNGNADAGGANLGGEPSLMHTSGAVRDISARISRLWQASFGGASSEGIGP